MSDQSSETVVTTGLQHIGLILDGNRRWAEKAGVSTHEGHRRGAQVFKDISLQLFAAGIPYVSAYIFSQENWRRAEEEVSYLMRLFIKAVELHLNEFHKNGIRISVIGSREGLSPSIIDAIDRTEAKTAGNTKGRLLLCFNYSGREEIVSAAKQLLNKKVSADELTEALFAEGLYAPEVPDVDLVLRTSGEQRLSGFMLWRASYAEFAFIDTYWPEVTFATIKQTIDDYTQRERRFGC